MRNFILIAVASITLLSVVSCGKDSQIVQSETGISSVSPGNEIHQLEKAKVTGWQSCESEGGISTPPNGCSNTVACGNYTACSYGKLCTYCAN